jgi:hypothetical protein
MLYFFKWLQLQKRLPAIQVNEMNFGDAPSFLEGKRQLRLELRELTVLDFLHAS